jgi:hypothetical protein
MSSTNIDELEQQSNGLMNEFGRLLVDEAATIFNNYNQYIRVCLILLLS